MMMRDDLEGFKGLTPKEAMEADRRLREKSGIGLQTVQKAFEKKVREILKRGKVETAEEYRILETRAAEISEKVYIKKSWKKLSKLSLQLKAY